MSAASKHSRGISRRLKSLQDEAQHSRTQSGSVSFARRPMNANIAYSYALRVAYLDYLIQPRARRVQNVSSPQSRPKRTSTFHDLMSDFSLTKDSKSTKFPHGFISVLEKRLTGILVGKEKRKEYQDPLVVRSFAVFLNTLKDQSFKKRMDKDRRAEDLVLIFYSNATKELGKGKDPDDDHWKFMVDRHVALFVRLFGLILKDQDWAKDRPELANRLSVFENKLLSQDHDLFVQTGDPATTVEVPIPLSYDVRDMPLVQLVSKIFGVSATQAQSDIDAHRSTWTEKAALKDLKTYQAQLNLQTGKTLSREDFESEEAYENWKKSETPELSQMMLAIVQSNPELTKSTPGEQASADAELSRTISNNNRSSRVFDQLMDIGSPISNDSNGSSDESDTYTFIPPDPRTCYRYILFQTLCYDMRDRDPEQNSRLLTKQSTELLNAISARWRLPRFSKAVLFLDVAREMFVDNVIDLDDLDTAFTLMKDTPIHEGKKHNSVLPSILSDRGKWTIQDLGMMQQLLSSLHEALLRELYDVMMDCYELKPRPIGPVMYVLEGHIQLDPNYTEDSDDIERFRQYVFDGLSDKARLKYQDLLSQEIPPDPDLWKLDHVMQLGQSITQLAQKIQKRYRNNPEIMG